MKKLILVLMVALLAAFAAPALAGDGNLVWTADKQIHLDESFSYTETVAFIGSGVFVFEGEAWAKIQEQQELYSNFVNEYNPLFNQPTKAAQIINSFTASQGVANINQAPGNLNNQGNEVAISVASKGFQTQPPSPGPGEALFVGMFAEAQVVSVQYNGILAEKVDSTYPITRTPAGNTLSTWGTKSTNIDSSFAGFFGVANVNQASGTLNNQGNAVAIAAGIDQQIVKAATHVMLAQASGYNNLTEYGGSYTDSITNGSFNNAHGVMNVNQASGSMNNQKNIVTLGFSHPSQ